MDRENATLMHIHGMRTDVTLWKRNGNECEWNISRETRNTYNDMLAFHDLTSNIVAALGQERCKEVPVGRDHVCIVTTMGYGVGR